MSQPVLFEIGVEELPARFIKDAEQQLKEKTTTWFTDLRIPYEAISVFSTPRRLAIRIEGVAENQTTIEEEVRGPALHIAKKDGEWTKAAIGFTRGQGKTVADITIKDVKGTEYIFVHKITEGQPTKTLLPTLKNVITSLTFPQQMRWGSETFSFARPIRWLLALYGDQVIPFEITGVETSNETKGHRFLGKNVTVTNPYDYERLLDEQYVIVDPKERSNRIVAQIKAIEQQNDFQVIIEDSLLREVTNLVEYPTAFVGTYAQSFLSLPSEVLVTSMQEHQRYFPVKKENKLLPYFISVRNGDDNHIENVVKGNEKVLQARLADGEFFFEEDQKKSINTYNEMLESIVFQEKLGTIHDKVTRVQKIAVNIAKLIGVDQAVVDDVEETAKICKFDLPTLMVNEFPELQGVMGEKYARIFGVKDDVALAIKEHYFPLHAGGKLPSTEVGSIVSVADKLDTIVGCISVGLMPTGSRDPYGLRRQGIGVLRIVHASGWKVSVEQFIQIVQNCLQEQRIEQTTSLEDLKEFVRMRASYVMRELGIEQDIIDSVLHQDIGVFSYRLEKAKQLFAMRNNETYKQAQEAFIRVLNMEKQAKGGNIHEELFETESERSLYEQYKDVKDRFTQADHRYEANVALESLATLAQPIEEFFEHNMVMTDNMDVRLNRLALLSKVASLIRMYAHIDKIEWKQTF